MVARDHWDTEGSDEIARGSRQGAWDLSPTARACLIDGAASAKWMAEGWVTDVARPVPAGQNTVDLGRGQAGQREQARIAKKLPIRSGHLSGHCGVLLLGLVFSQ